MLSEITLPKYEAGSLPYLIDELNRSRAGLICRANIFREHPGKKVQGALLASAMETVDKFDMFMDYVLDIDDPLHTDQQKYQLVLSVQKEQDEKRVESLNQLLGSCVIEANNWNEQDKLLADDEKEIVIDDEDYEAWATFQVDYFASLLHNDLTAFSKAVAKQKQQSRTKKMAAGMVLGGGAVAVALFGKHRKTTRR